MKTTVIKIALGCTVVALLLFVMNTKNAAKKEIHLATVETVLRQPIELESFLENNKTLPQMGSVMFPEIQNRIQRTIYMEESGEVSLMCPFVPTVSQVVFDFTHNGTVSYEDLFVCAHKSLKDAVRESQTTYLPPGSYSVQLATLNHVEQEQGYELAQQWYLELYSKDTDLLFTTPVTTDMESSDVRIVELVAQGVRVDKPAVVARAVHGAFQDVESQKVAPLCALFTQTDASEEERIILPRHVTTDFTAAAFTQYATQALSKTTDTRSTISILLILLTMVTVFLSFARAPSVNDRM